MGAHVKKVRKTEYTCKPGDYVISKGRYMIVNEIIAQGVNGKKPIKACISACRVMDDGQIMKRTSFPIGTFWRHTKKRKVK